MPAWLDNAVFYQVYPQSFFDTNGDGVGDLPGVTAKLEYIHRLGCNAVWLNPCFVSPFCDAGYDVADYLTVAPRYGTNQDLKDLLDRAHRLGMHVLLDLVAGHTSVEHPWFVASMKAEPNPCTHRYVWTDSIWHAPDPLGSLRGISERDGTCAVNFFSSQPALNYGYAQPDPQKPWQQPCDAEGPRATLEALKDVMRFWLDFGADGFRVDMAMSLVKGDPDHRGTMALWRELRAFLDQEYPEAALVSEWGQPDEALNAGFHMDFLLQFGTSHYNDLVRCERPYFSARARGDASRFVQAYQEFERQADGRGLMCLVSGNHDCPRLSHRLQGRELALAFAFLATMPGAPFIYYGDELGMRYVEGLTSVEGGYDRTGSRTPMQWDAGLNAGFSCASPEALYIPLDPDPARPCVATQEKDGASLLHMVRSLLGLRADHPALQSRGQVRFVSDGAEGAPLAYVRAAGGQRLLVALNPAPEPQTFEWTEPVGPALWWLGGGVAAKGSVVLEPQSAVVWSLEGDDGDAGDAEV